MVFAMVVSSVFRIYPYLSAKANIRVDFRRSNILIRITSPDQMSEDLLDMLGRPTGPDHLTITYASPQSNIPDLFLQQMNVNSIDVQNLTGEICITASENHPKRPKP